MIDSTVKAFLQLLLVSCCVASGVFAGSELKQSDADSVAGVIDDVKQGNDADTQGIDGDEISRIIGLSNDYEYGEYLAGECASCHLAKPGETSEVPVIHGAEPAYLVEAFLEYRVGIRSNSTMALVAKGLGDEELSAIVHFLATPP